MPELPEVQTVVSDLNRKIKGYKIVDFWTEWGKSVQDISIADFKKKIIGRKIEKAERKGKNILIFLSGGWVILVHLKMTGHLLVKKEMTSKKEKKNFDEKVNQYLHHKWQLTKGRKSISLEFSDLRKFGKIRLINKKDLKKDSELERLGVDPLTKDFTFEKLECILKEKKTRMIRNILLDQSLISGIGNIYVSEILFDSKINPERLVGDLSKKEIEILQKNIIKILKDAIVKRGTSDSDYRDTSGSKGSFQNFLKVYNREHRNCKRKSCSGKIQRKKIQQRSSFACSKCQK